MWNEINNIFWRCLEVTSPEVNKARKASNEEEELEREIKIVNECVRERKKKFYVGATQYGNNIPRINLIVFLYVHLASCTMGERWR